MPKGRALLAPCLLIAIWATIRIGMLSGGPSELSNETAFARIPEANRAGSHDPGQDKGSGDEFSASLTALYATEKRTAFRDQTAPQAPHRRVPRGKVAIPANPAASLLNAHKPFEASTRRNHQENSAPFKRPAENSVAPTQERAKDTSRFSLYGYGYWRQGDAVVLAPAAQYGGSQIGLIASYRLGERKAAPSLLMRVSSEADSLRQAEIALGMRWPLFGRLPVELSLERRFRRNSSDAFAAYIAGGWSAKGLPLDFRLSGYGQVGIVVADKGPQKASHFYDGNIRVARKALSIKRAKVSIGAGVWAGGQRGINRVDTGPTASVDFGLAQTNFRLSADYRFRVAGNAEPGSGLAITLSANY